jgi:hypothetical protein
VRWLQPEQSLSLLSLRFYKRSRVERGPLLAADQDLVFGAVLSAGDARLADPASEAAGWQAKALGHDIAAEALLQAELNGLSLLLWCESAYGLGGDAHLTSCALPSQHWLAPTIVLPQNQKCANVRKAPATLNEFGVKN